MSVGLPITKDLIDQRAGSLLSQIHRCLKESSEFNDWISRTDLGLDTIYGDAQGLADLKAAFAAMDRLWDVSNAQATQANVDDFWFVARRLIGIP